MVQFPGTHHGATLHCKLAIIPGNCMLEEKDIKHVNQARKFVGPITIAVLLRNVVHSANEA